MNDLLAQVQKLSPAARDALMRDVVAAVARKSQQAAVTPVGSLTAFKKLHWSKYQHVPHLQAIDDLLTQAGRFITSAGAEGLSRAALHIPPRHGKSATARYFAAWVLAQRPDIHVMIVTHSQRLANDHSRAIRSIISRPDFQQRYPQTRLQGSRRQDRWETSAGGGLLASGVTGAVAGFGAHLLLCDDLIAKGADAESATMRRRLEEAYESDLLSRLAPEGVVVVIGTRWQAEDIYSYIVGSDPDFVVLRLPALAEEDDPLGRAPGTALWEAKYSTEWLEKQRTSVGTYAFQALYQNEPQPRGDALFDVAVIPTIDIPPTALRRVRFYDLAVSAKSRADYSVGLLLAETPGANYCVLHVDRWQGAPSETLERIVANAQADGREVRIVLEADNHARSQADFLLRDPRLKGYSIELKTPQGDKFTRALPAAARANNGQLSVLRASWNRAFFDELALFPQGKNDDQVDSLSGAYSALAIPVKRGTLRRYRTSGLYRTANVQKDRPAS